MILKYKSRQREVLFEVIKTPWKVLIDSHLRSDESLQILAKKNFLEIVKHFEDIPKMTSHRFHFVK